MKKGKRLGERKASSEASRIFQVSVFCAALFTAAMSTHALIVRCVALHLELRRKWGESNGHSTNTATTCNDSHEILVHF